MVDAVLHVAHLLHERLGLLVEDEPWPPTLLANRSFLRFGFTLFGGHGSLLGCSAELFDALRETLEGLRDGALGRGVVLTFVTSFSCHVIHLLLSLGGGYYV